MAPMGWRTSRPSMTKNGAIRLSTDSRVSRTSRRNPAVARRRRNRSWGKAMATLLFARQVGQENHEVPDGEHAHEFSAARDTQMAHVGLGHEIVRVQERLVLVDHQHRRRHDLLDGGLDRIKPAGHAPTDDIRVGQDPDDLAPLRDEQTPDVVVPQLFRRRFDCRVPIHPPDFLHRDHHRFNRHHAAPSSPSLLDPALHGPVASAEQRVPHGPGESIPPVISSCSMKTHTSHDEWTKWLTMASANAGMVFSLARIPTLSPYDSAVSAVIGPMQATTAFAVKADASAQSANSST